LVSVAIGSHEKPFERSKVSALRDGVAYDVPVVCATASGRTSYAITQANLAGYTGASLWREGAALRVRLSAVPDRTGPAYVLPAGLTTAWRVVMLGDRAGAVLPSVDNGKTLPCLNDKPMTALPCGAGMVMSRFRVLNEISKTVSEMGKN
jgi:hypothetical protein